MASLTDADLILAASSGLNAIAAKIEGRVAYRVNEGRVEDAAELERVSDIIRKAMAAAETARGRLIEVRHDALGRAH